MIYAFKAGVTIGLKINKKLSPQKMLTQKTCYLAYQKTLLLMKTHLKNKKLFIPSNQKGD